MCNDSPCVDPCSECQETTNPCYQDTGCLGTTPLECTVYKGEGIECLNINDGDTGKEVVIKLATAICDITNDGDDQYVKVTSNDTTSGYLKDKIKAGAGCSIAEVNDGLNEYLRVDVDSSGFVQTALVVNSTDNTISRTQTGTANHTVNLGINISQDSGNSIVKRDDGLFALGHVPDYKVKVNAADTPDFLENQIEVAPDPLGIVTLTKTVVNGKLVLTPSIDVMAMCSALADAGCLCTQNSNPEVNIS